jgi:beta-glucosidase-like glycosyl hydrolase
VRKVRSGINTVVKEVEKGRISEKRIDESVKRILKAKGYSVVE